MTRFSFRMALVLVLLVAAPSAELSAQIFSG